MKNKEGSIMQNNFISNTALKTITVDTCTQNISINRLDHLPVHNLHK